MADIINGKYALADPYSGLTVFSLDGGELNMFGSCTKIRTSQVEVYPAIDDAPTELEMESKSNFLSTLAYGLIGAAVSACFAAVAISIVASATVLTGGAALAACAFMGASLATFVAATGMVESDLRTRNNRSPVEFTAELMGAAFIGFGAGATVYGIIAAAPALAAGASTEIAMHLGKSNFTEKVVPNIIKAGGGAIAAAETVFSVNDAYACGSGYNPLLDVAFDNDIEAYETAEFCIDTLALGYVQAAEACSRVYSSEGVYIESENDLNDYDDYKDEIYPLYSKKTNTGEFSKLKEPITIEHVKMICEDAGIDYSGIKIKIVDDPDLVGSGFLGYTHPDGKTVDLYPDTFKNRETLVKTLGHERIHIMQNRLYGPPQDSHMCGLFEEAALQSEEDWWNYYKSVNGEN